MLFVKGRGFGCILPVKGPAGHWLGLRGSGHAIVRWSARVELLIGLGRSILASGRPEIAGGLRTFCARGIVGGVDLARGLYRVPGLG